MYEQEFQGDVLYMMLYAVVAALNLVACCYLLFRRGNAFAPDITSPVPDSGNHQGVRHVLHPRYGVCRDEYGGGCPRLRTNRLPGDDGKSTGRIRGACKQNAYNVVVLPGASSINPLNWKRLQEPQGRKNPTLTEKLSYNKTHGFPTSQMFQNVKDRLPQPFRLTLSRFLNSSKGSKGLP